jgi:hypothetical protein
MGGIDGMGSSAIARQSSSPKLASARRRITRHIAILEFTEAVERLFNIFYF